MEYNDYFQIKHDPDDVTMDDFVSEAMRTDLQFRKDSDELQYLRISRMTLKNEVLTCYEFVKEKGLLKEYHEYRDGE